MAIKTNTTKTIKKTSSVLLKKCEATQTNMKKLCRDAGLGDEAKMIKAMIPRIPGSDDDVQFAGFNGVSFYFMRGETVNMPEAVAQMLRECGKM